MGLNLHVNASMEKREREREKRERERERERVIHAWAKSGWIERYYLDSRQSKHFIQTKFL